MDSWWGFRYPISIASCSDLVLWKYIFWPLFIDPLRIFTYAMTPLYVSYFESKIKALSWLESSLVLGEGIFFAIVCKSSETPVPS